MSLTLVPMNVEEKDVGTVRPGDQKTACATCIYSFGEVTYLSKASASSFAEWGEKSIFLRWLLWGHLMS